MLKHAIKYLKNGYSIIPTGPDKRPLLMSWKECQTKKPEEASVMKWWKEWPAANIAVITGQTSGVMVVDIDQPTMPAEILETLPETLITPIAKTPRGGSHYFFVYRQGLVNRSKIIQNVDVRTDGGYALVAPSTTENGLYRWLDGLSIFDVPLAPIPDKLFNKLRNQKKQDNSQPDPKFISLDFNQGSRDDALYHVALCLLRGGMHPQNAEGTLIQLAAGCNPPFPEREAIDKVRSAMKKAHINRRDLDTEIREWLQTTWGNVSVGSFFSDAGIKNQDEKTRAKTIFEEYEKTGILERVPDKNGVFRKTDSRMIQMNYVNGKAETTDLMLPFNLHNLVETMPGNIILVAGEPNSGKTAFLLNIIRDNMGKFDIHYFNSEMGEGELTKRIHKFEDISPCDWRFRAYERNGDFADVIQPGKNKINVIDFLEIHDNFYTIGGKLAEIHNKLRGAIAIIAIQKNKGTDLGLGGFRNIEKPRLALALKPGTVKVVKAKNWKTDVNPNYLELDYKIISGWKLFPTTGWRRPKNEQDWA